MGVNFENTVSGNAVLRNYLRKFERRTVRPPFRVRSGQTQGKLRFRASVKGLVKVHNQRSGVHIPRAKVSPRDHAHFLTSHRAELEGSLIANRYTRPRKTW